MDVAFKRVGTIPDRCDLLPAPEADADRPGCYQVIADQGFPRLIGVSPVLYIGSAAKLGRRLSPRHDVLRSLYALKLNYPKQLRLALEVVPFEPEQIPWKVSPAQWVRFIESTLLASYQRAHLELPPLNSRGEGDVLLRALATIGDALSRFRIGIKCIGTAGDENEHKLSTLGFVRREGQNPHEPIPLLVWTWPRMTWGDVAPWWASQLQADRLHLAIPDRNPLLRLFPSLDFNRVKIEGEQRSLMCAPLTELGWQQDLESGDFRRVVSAMDTAVGALRRGTR